jgi:fimbrial chaperone protein
MAVSQEESPPFPRLALQALRTEDEVDAKVSPVRVELSAQRPVAALTIRNEMADEAVVVQLRTVAWTQQEGREVHAETTDLLATPPIFTLAAGASQILRVGLRRPVEGSNEVAYRLFVREVPQEPKPGFTRVMTALEMSIPLFAKPRVPVAPSLEWQLKKAGDGGYSLLVRNEGNAHAQVANLALSVPDAGEPLATFPGFAYLLPGQGREIALQRGAQAALPAQTFNFKLTAYTDAGDIALSLSPENR